MSHVPVPDMSKSQVDRITSYKSTRNKKDILYRVIFEGEEIAYGITLEQFVVTYGENCHAYQLFKCGIKRTVSTKLN